MKRGWRFAVAVALGVFGWLWLFIRLVPSLLRGKPVLPPAEPVPAPDTSKLDEALQRGTETATTEANQQRAEHERAADEVRVVVEEVPQTRSRARRRELLAKLADKVDAR